METNPEQKPTGDVFPIEPSASDETTPPAADAVPAATAPEVADTSAAPAVPAPADAASIDAAPIAAAPAVPAPADAAPIDAAAPAVPAPADAAPIAAAPTPLDTAEAAAIAVESAPDASGDDATRVEEATAAATDKTGRVARGQLIEGTVIRTTPTEVWVDLGNGVEGVIPGRELERMARQQIDTLRADAQVMVYVVNPHDHQGKVLLSITRAIEEMDWKEAESYQKSQKVYEGHIAGYNKGGLIVRFGRLRGFVPQSQIADDRRALLSAEATPETWEKMVNQAIVVKVVEVDRARNRLILSERAAMREAREKRKELLVGELSVGDVRTGRVVSLEDFGAFVDIGGAEGLVHLTELSWKHVTHPREVLRVGQQIKVEVISVDKKRKRIGLSIKRQEADPWDEVASTYQIGQLVQGKITKLTKFGAFAQLVDAPEIEGLIHISELSEDRVTHPREVVNEGDKLTLRVVKIDVTERRLGLSLKRVNSAEYLDMDWRPRGE